MEKKIKFVVEKFGLTPWKERKKITNLHPYSLPQGR
jgi:hypothetical protein